MDLPSGRGGRLFTFIRAIGAGQARVYGNAHAIVAPTENGLPIGWGKPFVSYLTTGAGADNWDRDGSGADVELTWTASGGGAQVHRLVLSMTLSGAASEIIPWEAFGDLGAALSNGDGVLLEVDESGNGSWRSLVPGGVGEVKTNRDLLALGEVVLHPGDNGVSAGVLVCTIDAVKSFGGPLALSPGGAVRLTVRSNLGAIGRSTAAVHGREASGTA